MAWRDSLLDCSFRDFVFDVVSTADALERAVAEHRYPYVDGADIEDMGGGPRTVSLEAVFFGPDYENRLQDFLLILAEPGDGRLQHPVFGVIEHAQLRRYAVNHQAEMVDFAAVSLEFVEATPANPFFYRDLPIQRAEAIGALGDTALDAAAETLGDIVDTLKALNPFAALEGLRQDMLGPLLAFTAAAQGIVTSGLDVLAFPRAWARDVATLANGVLNIASFDDRLLQDWRAVASVFAGIAADFGYGSRSTPATVTPWRRGSVPSEAQARAVAKVALSVQHAVSHADAAALVLAAEATVATLSPLEIEGIANAARTEVDAAIEAARLALGLERSRAIAEPLRDQALAIQEAARSIIEARPPLIRRRLDAPGNLRLIAHRWYGDHTRAAELIRLNPIRHPNALAVGDTLNAYAQ